MFGLFNAISSGKGFINEGVSAYFDYAEYVLLVVLLALGYFSSKKENKPGMYIFLIFSSAPAIYIMYTFFYNIRELTINITYASTSLSVISTITGLICLGLLPSVFMLGINIISNFEKGLKGLKFTEIEQRKDNNVFGDVDLNYIQFEDDESEDAYNIMDVIKHTKARNNTKRVD